MRGPPERGEGRAGLGGLGERLAAAGGGPGSAAAGAGTGARGGSEAETGAGSSFARRDGEAAAALGATLGFLWWNGPPAKIFMGDTGSLALGGMLAAMAVLTETELLLVIIGGLYVVEILSVIAQVASFRIFKRRLFKMAPLHHHFELSGWAEPKVIVRFWILALLFALLSLSTLKLR